MKDFTQLIAPYENQWVAISEDETQVLASGTSLEIVKNTIDQKRLRATYIFISPFDYVLAP